MQKQEKTAAILRAEAEKEKKIKEKDRQKPSVPCNRQQQTVSVILKKPVQSQAV